jgi:RHS repeat-associated protein
MYQTSTYNFSTTFSKGSDRQNLFFNEKEDIDYYPFGMLMPNRHGSPADGYRYGFNGEESDDEVFGTKGTSYDLGARTYDARIGRMRSADPLESEYPWQSTYAYYANSPTSQIDYKGMGGGDDGKGGNRGTLESSLSNDEGNYGSAAASETPLSTSTGNKLYITVQVDHGRANGPQKSLGGKSGGHVTIGIGEEVYGFSNTKHGGKLIGRKNMEDRDGVFNLRPSNYHNLENHKQNVSQVIIPVTLEQYNSILTEYRHLQNLADNPSDKNYNTPYDYAIFRGERCASSAMLMLMDHGIIDRQTGFLQKTILVSPAKAYRYLRFQAEQNGWEMKTNYQDRYFIKKIDFGTPAYPNIQDVKIKQIDNTFKKNRFDRRLNRKLGSYNIEYKFENKNKEDEEQKELYNIYHAIYIRDDMDRM